MIVGLKDGIKLLGISVVSACAVFVCTFMLNFRIDARSIEYAVTEQMRALYDAQIAMSKLVCIITGGVLGVIAAIMLVFYIKLYIEENVKTLGVLKAMGYSNGELAARFWTFGLSVFVGCAAGFGLSFAAMPAIYKALTVDGLPDIVVRFNAVVPIALVACPTLVFTAAACGYAAIALRRPLGEMLRGNREIKRVKTRSIRKLSSKREREKPFLAEMCFKTVGAKKSLAFFVAFACFCFSAMVQMGWSMFDNKEIMGLIILGIGLALAAVITVMTVTTLVNSNKKSVALMRAMGYSTGECALTVFVGYAPFAIIGFALGTAYQYGLMRLMIDLLFKDMAVMPEYSFDVGLMFATFAIFVVLCVGVTAVFARKLGKTPVKQIMSE